MLAVMSDILFDFYFFNQYSFQFDFVVSTFKVQTCFNCSNFTEASLETNTHLEITKHSWSAADETKLRELMWPPSW